MIKRFNYGEDYNILLNKIEAYRIRDNVRIHAYVLMPEHFHLLLTIPDVASISSYMRDLKKRTAYEYFKRGGSDLHRFWEHRFDDVYIYSHDIFITKLNYIHYNPVRAGFSKLPEDWPYSSANYYTNGEKSIIQIDPIML